MTKMSFEDNKAVDGDGAVGQYDRSKKVYTLFKAKFLRGAVVSVEQEVSETVEKEFRIPGNPPIELS